VLCSTGALADARISRGRVRVTSAVKHFKFQPLGKRRIHQKPNAGEVKACRWWLDRELVAIGPAVAVALGATAAQSLAGRPVPIMKNRGPTEFGRSGLAHQAGFVTVHPSSLLRLPDHEQRAKAYDAFVADLRRVRRMLEAGKRATNKAA
jgi:DNA polymerase